MSFAKKTKRGSSLPQVKCKVLIFSGVNDFAPSDRDPTLIKLHFFILKSSPIRKRGCSSWAGPSKTRAWEEEKTFIIIKSSPKRYPNEVPSIKLIQWPSDENPTVLESCWSNGVLWLIPLLCENSLVSTHHPSLTETPVALTMAD